MKKLSGSRIKHASIEHKYKRFTHMSGNTADSKQAHKWCERQAATKWEDDPDKLQADKPLIEHERTSRWLNMSGQAADWTWADKPLIEHERASR